MWHSGGMPLHMLKHPFMPAGTPQRRGRAALGAASSKSTAIPARVPASGHSPGSEAGEGWLLLCSIVLYVLPAGSQTSSRRGRLRCCAHQRLPNARLGTLQVMAAALSWFLHRRTSCSRMRMRQAPMPSWRVGLAPCMSCIEAVWLELPRRMEAFTQQRPRNPEPRSCSPMPGLSDFGLARLMPAAERQKRNRL